MRPRWLAAALLTLAFIAPPALAAVPMGDFVGWAYKPGEDDFPLRLHLTQPDGAPGAAPVVTIDLPSAKAGGLPTHDVMLTGDTLTFGRTSKAGVKWAVRATLRDKSLEGSITIGDDPAYGFTAVRSDDPIVWIDPATLADLPGTYLAPGGRLITITAWPWGELRAMDTLSGANRTLLPIAQDKFFMGPANYVSAPRAATVAIVRDAQRKPVSLAWHDAGAAAPVTLVRDWLHESPVRIPTRTGVIWGTMLSPKAPGPHPAVVILGGSDWKTRDDCRRDGLLFASLGVAALITDLRGHGQSEGETVASFDDLAGDAADAVRALRALPELRADRVGFAGRSRGGWLAPLAASKCSEAAFVIVFVPPAISPMAQETTRRMNIFERDHTDEESREASRYLDLMWKALEGGDAWTRYEAARDAITPRGWLDTLDSFDSQDSEDFKWCVLNMRHNPIPALERVRVPFLALFGERDENVVPEENLPLMEAALRRAANNDVTLKVVPKADHGLRIVGPDGPYKVHEFIGDAPEAYAWLRSWLKEHGVTPPTIPAATP